MSGTNLGKKCLESSPAERVLGVLAHKRLNRSQKKKMLSSSSWYPVPGHMRMAKSCTHQGKFMLDMGTFFYWEGGQALELAFWRGG